MVLHSVYLGKFTGSALDNSNNDYIRGNGMASIDIPDLINGILEILGGVFIFTNVFRIYRTKSSASFHWASALFFTSAGFWNIYYYPHLGQWFSFSGGVFIVLANVTYLFLVMRYWKNA